ncbi:phenylpyruvate tautomerase MIF-related protein [Mastigocladopsis repens]|uniref:phenylpyruvate tautomerase MIF-related protein n=1 Tax=Mastigocladopsis repens TaxID=221287 RepID=UPI0002EB88E6|nr:phenylpyruvate tautomerase MIF-related protein [Mastigocladopsis repens]
MPFVRIETNHHFNKQVIEDVMTQITEEIHIKKGDPVKMISVVVHTDSNVSFGSDSETPAAIVQVLNASMPAHITSQLTQGISNILLNKFQVPANRMYIFFQEFTTMHLVGWNGKTFAEILGRDDEQNLDEERQKAQTKSH